MSRTLSTEMQAVATAEVVRPIYLIDMEFTSGSVYFWSGVGNLTFNSNTYIGAGEMENSKLTDSQFTRCSAYLVLARYALPQLTNWVEDDRFQNMMDFYKARYGEEFDAILRDGVEYDDDGNSTIDDDEKQSVNSGRLVR